MLRQDDWQKSQLVTIGYQYGKEYGGHLAACIIMSCIMNRVRLGWYGNVAQAIANLPKLAASTEIPVFELPHMHDPAFVRLLGEVGSIYEGTKDYAKMGTYWCDTRRVDTPFFKDKILPYPERRVLDMNTLVVYK